jgi:hypothetical protein
MKRMTVTKIEAIEIQGIQLIDVHWATSTGRVTATSRAQDLNQYKVGQTFNGRLAYAHGSLLRQFAPAFEVKNA